jgi:hypothetical protein
MAVIAWTEIESFNNIRKYTQAYPEILNGNSTVSYRAKVKLHGTNAGIQIYFNDKVVAQSRTTELINGEDNAGFSKWVESNKTKWASIADDTDEEYVIFGEWIGPGIQKNVAVSEIPRKVFAVFAARHITSEDDSLIVEPYLLQELVKDIPDTYVLPWHNIQLEINWTSSVEELTLNVNVINEWVMEVEKNDPWVENTFGVKGTGEGLVFYPTSKEHLGLKNFNNIVFKAKGEKHKNIKTAAPAQVNAQAAANVQQFVDMVLTEARLEQGATFVGGKDGTIWFDMKLIGKFLAWIATDVQKETQDELEASGLTWDQVSKSVGNSARAWYLAKAKAL